MITDSLNAELLSISQKLENRKQIAHKLQVAKKLWTIEQTKLENAKRRMFEEFQDVEDLENVTLKSIWYDLLNKKSIELEREQVEYYQAKMQFESQQNKFDSLSFEIKSYEAQLFDFQTIKAQYERITQEKVEFLKATNHPIASEIFSKQEAFVKTEVYINEIHDALLAIEKVLQIIPEVIDDLKTAKSYATWDIIGGGAGATYLKRQKMKEAKLGIVEINYALDKLKRELKDLNPDLLPTEIKFDTSLELVDYFFDNIFVGMHIKNQIADGYNNMVAFFNSMMLLKEKLVLEQRKQHDLYQEQEKSFRELVEKVN